MFALRGRLAESAQRQLLHFSLRAIRKRHPAHAKTINSVAMCIVRKRAPHTAMWQVLRGLLGQETLARTLFHLQEVYVRLKIRQRRLCASGAVCHGCMSHEAEVRCVRCGEVRFCFGCLEYGACLRCEGQPEGCEVCE